MSKHMLSRLSQLWALVKAAEADWNTHLATNASSILAKQAWHAVDLDLRYPHPNLRKREAVLKSATDQLAVRFAAIAKVPGMQLEAIQLESHPGPHQAQGLETANAFLHRIADATEEKMLAIRDELALREMWLSARFAALRQNCQEVRKILTYGAATLDKVAEMKVKVRVTEWFLARREELPGQDIEQLVESLEVTKTEAEAVQGVYERQTLKLQENMTYAGIKTARQMLLTEFLK